MTAQPTPSSRRPIVAGVALVILAVVAAAGIWYLFLRSAGPAPVSLGGGATPAATRPASSPVAEASATLETPAEASPAAPAESAAAAGEGITGTWTVDPSIGSFDDFSGSFVGYRVRETLAGVGATEAVGRTPDVTGSVTIDGTTINAAEFTADLTTLRSDEGMRDGQLGRQGIETARFPNATFTLTGPVDIGSVPAEGEPVEVTVTGDFALHGVTKSVQIPLQAQVEGGVVTIVGSLPIAFADYDITKPESMRVLSIEDNGTLELQLRLARG